MNQPVKIPISFISEAPVQALAVDVAGLRRLLGYENKTPGAARQASYRFISKHSITRQIGGVYAIAEIQQALRSTSARRRMT